MEPNLIFHIKSVHVQNRFYGLRLMLTNVKLNGGEKREKM